MVSKAPAPVWKVARTRDGKTIVNLERKKPWPYVNHYSFHILDPEWGHITIKMSGHPPFGAQIILNGHEYVACQARKEGLSFGKEDNCFTEISHVAGLARIADTLRSSNAIGQLAQVCDRWICSACLGYVLDELEQTGTRFRYDYSIYQAEYSRNLLFERGSQLEQIFQTAIDRTRRLLDVKTLRTIFGRKQRPRCHGGKKQARPGQGPRLEIALETPVYDLTVFKAHFDKLTLRIYTKGERVLRVECIVHNARALRCGISLPRLPEILSLLRASVERFLNVCASIDRSFVASQTLEELASPSQVGKVRVGGIDLNQSRLRAAMEATVALSSSRDGFTVSQLAAKVRERTGRSVQQYKSTQAAYDLKKLRGKAFVRRIGQSRRYQATLDGVRTMAAALLLRDKILEPLLAACNDCRHDGPIATPNTIDALYRSVRDDMLKLLNAYGIAA